MNGRSNGSKNKTKLQSAAAASNSNLSTIPGSGQNSKNVSAASSNQDSKDESGNEMEELKSIVRVNIANLIPMQALSMTDRVVPPKRAF